LDLTEEEKTYMYKNDIQRLIEQSPLEIDTDIQMTGRPPTMANSEFLTNKEQGDWAERVVQVQYWKGLES
jgi:type II restriction enzyme